MHTKDDLLIVVLQTLRALIAKQCEALNLQTAIMETLIRGQDELVRQVDVLNTTLAQRDRLTPMDPGRCRP